MKVVERNTNKVVIGTVLPFPLSLSPQNVCVLSVHICITIEFLSHSSPSLASLTFLFILIFLLKQNMHVINLLYIRDVTVPFFYSFSVVVGHMPPPPFFSLFL